jgi:hypothetical protein
MRNPPGSEDRFEVLKSKPRIIPRLVENSRRDPGNPARSIRLESSRREPGCRAHAVFQMMNRKDPLALGKTTLT